MEQNQNNPYIKDFPILFRTVNSNRLTYLDNAATTQKPTAVIAALTDFYTQHNANVHRGIHTLSEEATDMYESAREKIAQFIGAPTSSEIIFTSGSTESLNLVVAGWAANNLVSNDVVVLNSTDHHSNLVAWQMLAKTLDLKLKYLSVDANGELDLVQLKTYLNEGNVKVVSTSHISNVLGTVNNIKEICKLAHAVGAKVVVDGAQAVSHIPVNVQSLDCDFYAFSGHKMFGPMGIGVLFGKRSLLENTNPIKFGGGMISTVGLESSTWATIPERFEGGTPSVADAIGLGAAVDYINNIGLEKIVAHESSLNAYLIPKLNSIKGLHILGSADFTKRAGLVSFYVDGIHSHDVASVLSTVGVAVRSGHHCAMPLHKGMSIASSTRASYHIYNTYADMDALVNGINTAIKILG